MESPGSWNRLTSSLRISDLNDPEGTWKFLVAQGLVRDDDVGMNTFVRIIEQECHLAARPGSSLPCCIARHMVQIGLATSNGGPDPYALRARSRRWIWRNLGL